MTGPEIIALVELGLEAGKTVAEVVHGALRQPEPPALEELYQQIVDTISARKEPWLARAREAGDKAEQSAAEAAFKGASSDQEP
jgi:hypothetical protein